MPRGQLRLLLVSHTQDPNHANRKRNIAHPATPTRRTHILIRSSSLRAAAVATRTSRGHTASAALRGAEPRRKLDGEQRVGTVVRSDRASHPAGNGAGQQVVAHEMDETDAIECRELLEELRVKRTVIERADARHLQRWSRLLCNRLPELSTRH